MFFYLLPIASKIFWSGRCARSATNHELSLQQMHFSTPEKRMMTAACPVDATEVGKIRGKEKKSKCKSVIAGLILCILFSEVGGHTSLGCGEADILHHLFRPWKSLYLGCIQRCLALFKRLVVLCVRNCEWLVRSCKDLSTDRWQIKENPWINKYRNSMEADVWSTVLNS